MAKPKIDFKKLMLEKGEKIGVGVGIAITVLLMIRGIMAASGSINTEARANSLTSDAKNIRSRIATGAAGDVPPLEPWVTAKVEWNPINPTAHLNNDFFVGIEIDSLKRGRPMIFGPTEFQVNLVREPIYVYGFILDKDGTPLKIFVKQAKKKSEQEKINRLEEKVKKFSHTSKNRGSRPGGPPGPGGGGMSGKFGGGGMSGGGPGGGPGGGLGGPGGGMGGPGGGMGGPGGGMGGMGGFPGKPGAGGGSSFSTEVVQELVPVPVKDYVSGKANFTPAQFILPMRAVVVTASIPWKKQLEEYQKQLRYDSLAALVGSQADQPQFKGFKVKRRVTAPDGRVGEWQDYDWQAAYEPIFVEKILDDHQDPAELQPVIPSPETRLLVPLPKLVRGEYPKVELPSIERTLAALKNSQDGNRVLPGGSKFEGHGDMFAPGGAGKPKDNDSNKGNEKNQQPEVAQEAFLMRFLDVDVQPGFGYEYQVQVVVANPNFGMKDKVSQPSHAAKEELESAPVLATFKDGERTTSVVRVAQERYVYSFAPETNESTPADHVRVQIQNWISNVRVDRNDPKAMEPIGDWVVENLPIARGQFVIGTKEVKMPIWSPTKDSFVFMELGKNSRRSRSARDKGMLALDLSAPAIVGGLRRRPDSRQRCPQTLCQRRVGHRTTALGRGRETSRSLGMDGCGRSGSPEARKGLAELAEGNQRLRGYQGPGAEQSV